MNLLPGEKRGYWKYHTPKKWFRQAKIRGKLDNHHALLLLDSGAEVSILDTTFAREVGCLVDTSITQECVGIRDETYYTMGRAKIKVTLAGNLVYFFEAWVGDLSGQNAILGMDFMVPAGIRLDAGDGSICLPDEVRIQMVGRRMLYGANSRLITPTKPIRVEVGEDQDLRIFPDKHVRQQLWVTRGKQWVPTVVCGRSGKPSYLRITNIGESPATLGTDAKLGVWMTVDMLPRDYGFVRVGSRRYQEWQNLACEATREFPDVAEAEVEPPPMTIRHSYPTPTAILRREANEPRSGSSPVNSIVIGALESRSELTIESKHDLAKGRNQRTTLRVATVTPPRARDDVPARCDSAAKVDPIRSRLDRVETDEQGSTPEDVPIPANATKTTASSRLGDRDESDLTRPRVDKRAPIEIKPGVSDEPNLDSDRDSPSGATRDPVRTEEVRVHRGLEARSGEEVEIERVRSRRSSWDRSSLDRDTASTDRSPSSGMEKGKPSEAEDEVYYHEGSDLFADELDRELAVLPEVSLTAEVKIDDIKIGRIELSEEGPTPDQEAKLRTIIWKRRKWLIGKGNALPPAAIGVVCDIDVGDAKPVAQRVRKIRPQFKEKVSELLKGLLRAGMIQLSTSPWASPIVVIVKKNGVDIRLCIDYRVVNSLTQLMVYPMPLINDLLEDLQPYLWYCSLDMASGFWVVPMTDRARLISAFITPFGLFEWLRMPFGLKNAPQIYQRLIDNALYGFRKIPIFAGQDVFAGGEADDPSRPSILGRRSYIDDILIGGTSWDDLCAKVERLLEACERWNLSISVEKGYWGMAKVDYLGHSVSTEGLAAKPKNLGALLSIEFPRTLKALQSFLGSLNYYHRFMPDFAVYATALYALTEDDFAEFRRAPDLESEKWSHAITAFDVLKKKIASAPILRHFDPDRDPIAIVYANRWAISAVLTQRHDGVYMPVKFTSRTLKPNELNYDPVEKEILALLQVLDECFTMLTGRTIRVLTRRTTLAWLFRSNGLQGRLSQWAARLSPWSLQIQKSDRGEEEILGAIAASITPRASVDAALEAISPRKRPTKISIMPAPRVGVDETLHVLSFDGSAKSKREGGAFSAVIWKLPEWDIVKAESEYDQDLTVNEAEYRGLLLGLRLLGEIEVRRLVVCGDSNLVIRQLRGEMDCKSPGLVLLRGRAWTALKAWPHQELYHVRREWNASADLLAGQALQRQAGVRVTAQGDLDDLKTLNRLPEVVKQRVENDLDPATIGPDRDPISPDRDLTELDPSPEEADPASTRETTEARHVAVTTRAAAARQRQNLPASPRVLSEGLVQQLRLDRIRVAQDEEKWIADLKKYLRGDVEALSRKEAKACSKLAYQYEEGEGGLLYYYSRGDEDVSDRNSILKLVIPETLHDDVLHQYHTSLEGGHQGVGRTYQRVRKHFHWPGIYKSVQRYVGKCVDCETGKGRPAIHAESPGNIVATYPFQVIAMDHIPSLPVSYKGNTELLVWVDLFTGFVIVRANASRSAETIAEAYEEAVFRRFGASEAIRHDREPGFMSDFFRAFNRLMGQRQRATMAYRPQANGAAERMVQTVTRAIKMYIQDIDQRDWDQYAERLTFALNTSQDRTRGETPFYLVHGWDPRTTLEAALSVGNLRRQDVEARRWRLGIQRHYKTARAQALEAIREAVSRRAELNNEVSTDHKIETGSQVWLYLDRVKPGYAKKLAHLWHGPFRVEELVNRYTTRLATTGTPYHLFPLVHVSKLKLVRQFPSRPTLKLTVRPDRRFDFDEELLPEDSWSSAQLAEDEFEVEAIVDMREGRATRYGRVQRDYKVKQKDREEPIWVCESDLNCGGLLYDFMRSRAERNRFHVMQSHEEPVDGLDGR